MTPRTLASTIRRIIGQLRHDRRTIAMILVVPTALIALLYFMFEGQERTFDRVALVMLGVFPFVIMFLITSIAMLRERTSGTLERLLTMPLGKGDLVVGYALAFGVVAVAQSVLATAAIGVSMSSRDASGADAEPLMIEGYASQMSCAPGEEIAFHISTNAPIYSLEIARMGADRKVVWEKKDLPGKKHPVPADAAMNGCKWPAATKLQIPADWKSGEYALVRIVRGLPNSLMARPAVPPGASTGVPAPW